MPVSRKDPLPDDLSPFQPSYNKPRAPATTQRPTPQPAGNGTAKTDQAFIDKVTNVSAADVFWTQTAKKNSPGAGMGKTSLMSTDSAKIKKAAEAFKAQGARRAAVQSQFSDFCEETSFTPLTRIYKASSWKRKFGWTFLLLAMLTWLTVQCYWLLEKYFMYPMEVKVDIMAAKELSFPSVSICNLNPVKKTFYWGNDEMAEMRHFGDMAEGDDMLYDYYYKHADTLFATPTSATPPNPPSVPLPTASTTTPVSLPPVPTTTPGLPPGTTPTTAGPPPAATTTTPSSPAPPPPGRRKKRNVDGTPVNPEEAADPKSDAESLYGSALGSEVHDRYYRHHRQHHQHQQQQQQRDDSDPIPSVSSDEDDYHHDDDDDDDARVAVRAGEGGGEGRGGAGGRKSAGVYGRVRRSAESNEEEEHERKRGMLMANSFNKWDALSMSTNVSYYWTRSSEYQATMAYATNFAKMDPETVRQSGHSLNDMLINCKFNGWPCSPNNFTYFRSYKYGNCYTIHSHDSPIELTTKYAGPENGLTLELFIQQDEYVGSLAAEAGVRVLIHPKGKYPFPEDEGLSIPPAHSTSISIREVRISRLPPPHGQCDDSATSADLYATTYNTSYSKLACLKSCYQEVSLRRCNCSMPAYIITDRNTVCNMTDPAVDKCTSYLSYRYPEDFTACDVNCPQPCMEVDYEKLSSSAAWPSAEYSDTLTKSVQQSNALLMDRDGSDDNVDFVKLNVYFRDLLYENIEQQKAYESQNLISDVGGQLGLWLGLSAITIGELCGLILSLFRTVTSAVKPQKEDGSTPVKKFKSPADDAV